MSYPGTADFIGGVAQNKYISFDGANLSIGDEVYQLSQIEGKYEFVLRTSKILALLSDGRIHIKGTIIAGTTTNIAEQTISCKLVWKNPIDLVMKQLLTLKFDYEVKIPQMKSSLETILSELNINPQNISVGEGIEGMEI